MRKGEIDLIEWFPRIILIIVAILFIVALISFFTDREIPAGEAHMATYAFRLHYDGQLVTYVDQDTGRVMPGTIDLARFSSTHIDSAYAHAREEYGIIASRLLLIVSECNASDDTKSAISSEKRTIYHDETTYKRYAPFVGHAGSGGAQGKEFRYPVTVVNGENRCPGMLQVNVVRPNS